MLKKLSIIIPAFNEANTIHLILDRIAAVELRDDIQKEIIIVNDCSTDQTELAIKNILATTPLLMFITLHMKKIRERGLLFIPELPKQQENILSFRMPIWNMIRANTISY